MEDMYIGDDDTLVAAVVADCLRRWICNAMSVKYCS